MIAQATSHLSISLLGAMEVKKRGEVVTGFRQKSKWLLAYLILQRGKEIDYEALGRLLWPEAMERKPVGSKQVIGSVRQCVSNLKTLLGSERFTKQSRSEVGIDLTQVYVDVFAFEAAAAHRDLASLREAVRLYTGDLLEGCAEDWIQLEREVRRQSYQGTLELLIEQAQAAGDLDTAEKYLRRAIAGDRFKEGNRCSLMRLLMRRGEYNAALDIFDQYRGLQHDPQRDAGPEMKRLREAIKARVTPEKARFPSSSSLPAPPAYCLPQPVRALVGREEAVGEVAALFLFGRLVTLKGPPGIGKTHLALQIAAYLQQDYPDGTACCDLADEKSPTDIWRALAAVLRIPDQPHQNLGETVCGFLASRQMLLILDNCEHLVPSGAHVVRDILRECPSIRLLTTSRMAWGTLPGERVYTVPPLSLPGAALLRRLAADPLPELSAFSAIRLFLERVSEIHSAFALTPQNARAVAQICQLLDGLPLAILLAAGWITTLTPEEILAHLSQGPELLRDTRQAKFARQSRLLLLLESSYQLLTPSLQALFRSLSPFRGGWTLKAAEEVCQTPRILDSLRQLQECSLVEAEQDGSEMRFRLLGILRQFGGRLLAKSAEWATTRHRHLDFFLRIAETAEPELVGPHQEAALARLDRELENLAEALEWACESQETEKGLRLAGALWRFWHVRGHYHEGLHWLERLLHQAAGVSSPARSKALNGAGNLAYQCQDYTRAQSWFQERLEYEQAQGSPRALAGALGSLANVTSALGDYGQARSLFERSLAYFRDLKEMRGVIMTLGNLAVVACKEGNLQEACAFQEECIGFFRSVGDRNNLAVALNNSVDIRLTLQEWSTAGLLLKESLEISRDLEIRHTLVPGLTFCFFLLARRGSLEQAAQLLGANEAFLERTQTPLPPEALEEHRRNAEQVRAGLDAETFQSARPRGGRMTLEETIAFALTSI